MGSGIIDISDKRVLFLGFGAVAKCVLYYFSEYFKYSESRITIVDRCVQKNIPSQIKRILLEVTSYNFNELLDSLSFSSGDIVIDLTACSDTYSFINISLNKGINYINTSIEDNDDLLRGTSIDLQQKVVKQIVGQHKNSNILTECGQNPGLIQHYILYALSQMDLMNGGSGAINKKNLRNVLKDYKIGTIYCSEVDSMEKKFKMKKSKIYNTWSVEGMISEATDNTELVVGKSNNYVKPKISKNKIKTYLNVNSKDEYRVLQLKSIGIHNKLNSICPVLKKNGQIKINEYSGYIIHHGEMFELARYFGKYAPFMAYVYSINKYAEKSIFNFLKRNSVNSLKLLLKEDCNSYEVFNNFSTRNKITGFDSIGCTIFCGTRSVDRVFWCGSILSTSDLQKNNPFTPTIVQVAAGVLSGLSYILEYGKGGLYEPCDLDTNYILNKSVPLLGKFFFTEIEKSIVLKYS